MAANIDEALANVANDIGRTLPEALGGSSLSTQEAMTVWVQTMFTNPNAPQPDPSVSNQSVWDRASLAQRSVYNWAVPTIVAEQQVNAQGPVQLAANIAIEVVYRTLLAVKCARTEGRITQDQEDLVVQVYTSAWE